MVGPLSVIWRADRLSLEEVYRFPNRAVRVLGNLHWDPLHLFNEMKARAEQNRPASTGRISPSVGVDTWGIDFALLDREGNLLGNPYCYRDSRTEGMMEEAFKHLSRREIFEQTGRHSVSIDQYPLPDVVDGGQQIRPVGNRGHLSDDARLVQLLADRPPEPVNLPMPLQPNFIIRCLGTGRGPCWKNWAFPPTSSRKWCCPALNWGRCLPDIANEVGFERLPVVAPATHDTASAVVAVPADRDNFAWLSSGTWSLLGGISDKPIVTPEALAYNFSSYGGVGGRCLPWKNIMGLWLVQECRRIWARAGDDFSYEELTNMAAAARPFTAIVEPDHPSFLAPSDMPAAIQAFCRDTGQSVPQTKGEIVRTALEGLALKYRWVVEKLEILLDRKFNVLHTVGGGSQNKLLCQFAADATQLPVIAGPVEATAIGNIAVQAIASGRTGLAG